MFLYRLAAACALWLCLTGAAHAKIEALVVGSDAYRHIRPLHRAVADARAVRDRLIARGVTPIYAENPTRLQLNRSISRFINRIEPGDTAFVYHSGHGVQLDRDRADTLFLLPTDLDPAILTQGDPHYALVSEAARFSDLRRRLAQRGARLRIFVLDNCRDNPLTQQGFGKNIGLDRGVGRVNAQQGEFVLFAAAPGEKALDRLGESDPNPNSVFTRVFLRHFQAGVAMEDLANTVQDEVYEVSAQGSYRQQPYYHDGVIGKACLEGIGGCSVQQSPVASSDLCASAPARPGYRCVVWNGFPSYERIATAAQPALVRPFQATRSTLVPTRAPCAGLSSPGWECVPSNGQATWRRATVAQPPVRQTPVSVEQRETTAPVQQAPSRSLFPEDVRRRYQCRTDSGAQGVSFGEKCWPLDTIKIEYNDISRSVRRELTDASPLAGLTGLQELSLGSTQVSDVTPLSVLTGLRILDLGHTPISDLTPLSGLTGLQMLTLSGTRVSDVTPLSGLAGLRELYLSSPPVSDVTPLSGLAGLQWLYLQNTQVSDLAPLSGLAKLYYLQTPDGQVYGNWRNTTRNRAAVAEAIRRWRPRGR